MIMKRANCGLAFESRIVSTNRKNRATQTCSRDTDFAAKTVQKYISHTSPSRSVPIPYSENLRASLVDYSYDLIQDRAVSRLGRDRVTRRDGMGWVTMGWDGMGWDGMGWSGVGMHLKVLRGCDAGLGWILLAACSSSRRESRLLFC